MTEDREARLVGYENLLKGCRDFTAYFISPVEHIGNKDFEWLITQLRSSWEREKIAVEGLERIKQVTYAKDDLTTAFIAMEAVQQIEKLSAKEGK